MTLHRKALAWVAGLALCGLSAAAATTGPVPAAPVPKAAPALRAARPASVATRVPPAAPAPAAAAPAPAASDNPYEGIIDRNVFGLKPPPPPPDPESLKPPASKITLTGIMTIFGKKQALMKTPPGPATPPKPGQPPEPPKEHNYMLAEGQREDDITVLQIDEVGKSVKVDNAGHIETLTFPTNEVKTASAPAPNVPGWHPNMPGMPTPAGFRSIPRPLRVPSMHYPGAAANPASTSATPTSSPVNGAMGSSYPYSSAYSSPYAPGQPGINANGVGLAFNSGPGISPQTQIAGEGQPVNGMSGEAQVLMLEATRQQTAQDVQSGKMGPLPTTQYTPAGAPGTLPQDNPTPSGNAPGSGLRAHFPTRPGMPQLPQ